MFYRPEAGHGLPHNPWNAIVAPRPIGWISTRGRQGDNLAPYSFFNATAYVPPQVMFASTGAKPDRPGTKDTVAQVAESRVFCINIADGALAQAMGAESDVTLASASKAPIIGFNVRANAKAREIAEEKEAIDQYGSSDSGASLGDILGAALKNRG